MQIKTSLLSLLVLTFAAVHSASASIAAPRDDASHKFGKREPAPGHRGRSAAGTVLTGTALAGGAAFAGTAGMIGAQRLFGDHHDHDHEREGGGGYVQQQPVYAAPQPQQREGAYPIGILMSDNSVLSVGGAAQRPPQYAAQAGGGAGAGGFVFPNSKK